MAEVPQPTIREAVAAFNDPEALKAAVSDLQSHGFDRADISFLAREGFEGHIAQDYAEMRQAEDDPAAKRDPVIDETDIRQRRTLDISTAATLAAFAAAGFTVATGGATALAAGLAVAAAGGVGGLGALLGKAYGQGQQTFLQEQLDRGGVLLWVRTPDAEAEQRALDILRRHSAHDVHVHEVPAAATAKGGT
jgi:hypothetical protein